LAAKVGLAIEPAEALEKQMLAGRIEARAADRLGRQHVVHGIAPLRRSGRQPDRAGESEKQERTKLGDHKITPARQDRFGGAKERCVGHRMRTHQRFTKVRLTKRPIAE
jgi:hypothetical protein